jgi:ribosomal protein L11 methyltransferase
MSFTCLTITLDRDLADAFSDELMTRGALSVSVADADEGTDAERAIFGEPGASTGLWDRCELTALFDGGTPSAACLEAMWASAATLEITSLNYTQSQLDDADWVKQTQAQFQPISISNRIVIVPTWHEVPTIRADDIRIVLDPGAAFGTGSHPTTRLCLQWLEANVHTSASVLDYGTGSGILAIAAKKLGAGETIGVDIDAAAVETARYNATQNDVEIAFHTTDQTLDYVADITVANILANPLKVLAPLLASHTQPAGKLVLAGILDDQAEDIIAIYRPWFQLAVWKKEEGWSCIAGLRLPS